MSKLTIYCFSGTGNSLNVAQWMADVAKSKGIEPQIVNIAHINRLHIPPPDPDGYIAFASPIHGFNYPPVMVNFIRRFPKGHNPVFLLNTRAGMLIGKWVTPGLTGIAFYMATLMLRLKGYNIKAMLPVDMPSNWISVHPGLNRRTVEYLHLKNKERVTAFANKVLAGKRHFKCLREVVQDVAIAPISLGYYFVGRFMMAKTYFASASCNNCGLCLKQCPVKAIKEVDGRPYWTFNCESCMHCMGYCPKQAIETAHGFIIGYAILFSTVILVILNRIFGQRLPQVEIPFLQFTIESVLFIVTLAVAYRLMHYLLRFRFFERLVTYTSLTKYQFWGRRYRALTEKKPPTPIVSPSGSVVE